MRADFSWRPTTPGNWRSWESQIHLFRTTTRFQLKERYAACTINCIIPRPSSVVLSSEKCWTLQLTSAWTRHTLANGRVCTSLLPFKTKFTFPKDSRMGSWRLLIRFNSFTSATTSTTRPTSTESFGAILILEFLGTFLTLWYQKRMASIPHWPQCRGTSFHGMRNES